MNLGEMRTAVYARAGVDSSDGLLTATVINGFIHDALDAYQVEGDWPWLTTKGSFNTVIGTDTYSPPAAWSHTLSLRLSADMGTHLTAWGPIDLDEAYKAGVTGKPLGFALDSEKIILRPVPDAVYAVEHRYQRTETKLFFDPDVPLMPARFHPALVEYAAALTLDRAGDFERADRCRAEYAAWVKRMADVPAGHTAPTAAPAALTSLRAVRDAVLRRAGVDTKAGVWSGRLVDGFVNDALHAVTADGDWPWLVATQSFLFAAGDDTQAVTAADHARTLSVRLDADNGRHLIAYQLVELDETFDTSTRGRPKGYAVDQGQIVVRPVPDAAYAAVHRYVRFEQDLVGDDDAPLMPVRYRGALVDLAAARLAAQAGDVKRAEVLQAAYDQWRERSQRDTGRDRRPTTIRTRW